MKAFQCSRCVQLQQDDLSDKVFCPFAQPVPRYRDKSDRELCLAAFKSLPPERQWHERFGRENRRKEARWQILGLNMGMVSSTNARSVGMMLNWGRIIARIAESRLSGKRTMSNQ